MNARKNNLYFEDMLEVVIPFDKVVKIFKFVNDEGLNCLNVVAINGKEYTLIYKEKDICLTDYQNFLDHYRR